MNTAVVSAESPNLHLQADLATGGIDAIPDLDIEREAAKPGAGRRPWFFGVMLMALGLGTLGSRWWSYAQTHVKTDNAYIVGHIHQIGARVSGTVLEVLVTDNAVVTTGTPLVQLDPRDFELHVQQASNQVLQAEAQLLQTEAQLKQARAQLIEAEAKAARASAEQQRAALDFDRAKRLTEQGRFAAMSQQEYDGLKAANDVAEASVRVGQAGLASAEALQQAAEAALAVAQARRGTAQVSLADARLQLSYTSIPAPVCGAIGRKSVEVGQRVQAGQALLAVVGVEKWVVANFKETQVARMHPGQPVRVRIDAIPGRSIRGRVDSFAPASGAQFALLPPDNATGNFTKIVQRVPVKVVLDPADTRDIEDRLAPGLSAVVDVQLTQEQP